jgi:choline dehydrogenase-like flavoprotein
MEQVDAVVVGVGAAGGLVAKELAVAGLRVMRLDRGPSFTASNIRPRQAFRFAVALESTWAAFWPLSGRGAKLPPRFRPALAGCHSLRRRIQRGGLLCR